jgi:hypothetical protein
VKTLVVPIGGELPEEGEEQAEQDEAASDEAASAEEEVVVAETEDQLVDPSAEPS